MKRQGKATKMFSFYSATKLRGKELKFFYLWRVINSTFKIFL